MKKSLLFLSLLTCLALLGCGGMTSSSDSDATAPAENSAVGSYWDFDDVLIPTGMKLEKEKSMIFNAEGHKGGLLVFSDNAELTSLVNFFNINMSKDNWLHKSSFKYPNVAMFFAKPDKTCIIQITESMFSTTVAIWVAPTAGSQP